MEQNPAASASENICERLLTPCVVWIRQQINAAGGVGGSTTMVVVFVVCLWCVLQSHLVVVTCHI